MTAVRSLRCADFRCDVSFQRGQNAKRRDFPAFACLPFGWRKPARRGLFFLFGGCLPGDDLVFDLVVHVLRQNFLVDEIVFAVVRTAFNDGC